MNSTDRVRELLEQYGKTPIETGPVELSSDYLRAVARIENLPENRPGADKSWVPAAEQEYEEHYRRARLGRAPGSS